MKDNPETTINGQWFVPAKYPQGVIVCPLCHLPETAGEYKSECKCWDEVEDGD